MDQSARATNGHLLIIDNAGDLPKRLEPRGYRVTSVSTAPEGLEALRREAIDVVLLDVELTQLDGLDALGEIRKRSARVPVVVLTSTDRIDRAWEFVRGGASGFLRRPFHDHELAQCLETASQRAKMSQELEGLKRLAEQHLRRDERPGDGARGAAAPAGEAPRDASGAAEGDGRGVPLTALNATMQLLHDGQSTLPPLREARDLFEKTYLSELLRRTGGNVTRASRLAGRNRTDFYELLRRHQLSAAGFKS